MRNGITYFTLIALLAENPPDYLVYLPIVYGWPRRMYLVVDGPGSVNASVCNLENSWNKDWGV